MAKAEASTDWRKRLRASRRALKVTLEDVAHDTGLSFETLRGYENGRRNPTRESLVRVLAAVNIPLIDANEILNEAGFAGMRTRFPEDEFPSYYFTRPELDAAVERVPWPEFVVGDWMEVVAANSVAEAIWDIDFQHEKCVRTRPQMNLLSVASDHHFADRVGNWDEIVGTMASMIKGPGRPDSIDSPSPYFSEVLAEFAKGDPTFLASLATIWAAAEPLPPKVRQSYRVVWIDPEFGEMRFQCLLSTCSEPDALAFNDWHPLDAETWHVLEQVKARHARLETTGNRPPTTR
jgi:transcriptional regulator with XRE-family HTH domain